VSGLASLRTPGGVFLVVALSVSGLLAQSLRDFTTPQPMLPQSVLIIGFVGGFERWNNEDRSVRRVALNLRALHLSNVFVETVENRRTTVALKLIRNALDRNRNGQLDPGECNTARLILYGQSLGGAAVIKIARELKRWGVPVLLTVQVDSVGFNDGVIPANVFQAANFYQHDPLTIQGRQKIRAEDPGHTRILCNVRMAYSLRPGGPVNGAGSASWVRKTFGGSHMKMELDPAVWMSVQSLIETAVLGAG
jgi:hypothetical protein